MVPLCHRTDPGGPGCTDPLPVEPGACPGTGEWNCPNEFVDVTWRSSFYYIHPAGDDPSNCNLFVYSHALHYTDSDEDACSQPQTNLYGCSFRTRSGTEIHPNTQAYSNEDRELCNQYCGTNTGHQ